MSNHKIKDMSNLDSIFTKACTEITENLLTIKEPNKGKIKEEIKKICAKYALERIPKTMKFYQL